MLLSNTTTMQRKSLITFLALHELLLERENIQVNVLLVFGLSLAVIQVMMALVMANGFLTQIITVNVLLTNHAALDLILVIPLGKSAWLLHQELSRAMIWQITQASRIRDLLQVHISCP